MSNITYPLRIPPSFPITPGAAAWKNIDWMKLTKLNVAKVRSLMKAEGIDALFAHHGAHFQYVTGYLNPIQYPARFAHRQAAIVLAEEEQPVMLAGAADYCDIKSYWWIDDVRSMPMNFERWPEIIKGALYDHGLKEGKLAVDSTSPYTLVDSIRKELGHCFTYVSAGKLLTKALSVLNEEEIKVMRRAAAITAAMMIAGKAACKEGVREVDVLFEMNRAMERVEPMAYPCFRQMVMSGERGGFLDRPATTKIILRGDIVSIDAGCRYLGYSSEWERHVMVGKPTEEQKRLYRAAYNAEQAVVNALKPGISVLELDRISRKIIEEAGYGDYQMAHYTGHQHGLGNSPKIGDPGQTEDYILEPGMVCAIEPGIFKPGVGGVRIEDSVLITETGHEVLSNVDECNELLD